MESDSQEASTATEVMTGGSFPRLDSNSYKLVSLRISFYLDKKVFENYCYYYYFLDKKVYVTSNKWLVESKHLLIFKH